MSGRTWTLWQRLPPRYQLTTQGVEVIADDYDVTDDPLSPKLYPTPRDRPHSTLTEKRPLSASVSQRARSEMNHYVTRNSQFRDSFPRRASDYVNHFQSQKRVNSVRRRFAESPPSPTSQLQQSTTGPSISSATTPRPRAHTAPLFPITNPRNFTDERKENIVPNKQNTTRSLSRNDTRSKVEATKVDCFQFDDSKSVASTTSSSRTAESVPKKYVIQDTKEAIMYIDNGRVTYFRKSRHDLTNILKTQSLRSENMCFLAEIRQDYLKHPKYGTRRSGGRLSMPNTPDPGQIANDRVRYNRRIDHILNYYSDEEESPPSQTPPSSAARVRSSRVYRAKGLSLTGAQSRPPSRNPSPTSDRPGSPNDFIKLNKQSKLHTRQFYLRTPSLRHNISSADLAKCRCSMCRVELQLALVTGIGINNDLALMATGTTVINTKENAKPHKPVSVVNKVTVELQSNDSDKTLEKQPKGKEPLQRVTFEQTEVAPKRSEHTLTISCTLPEVSNMAVSESGLDSSRTIEDFSQRVQDEITSSA